MGRWREAFRNERLANYKRRLKKKKKNWNGAKRDWRDIRGIRRLKGRVIGKKEMGDVWKGEEGRFSTYVELRYRARGIKTRVEEGSKGRDRLVGRESWF